MASALARRNALPARSTVVLLVESHEDIRTIYAECLRACGFTVMTADSTDERLRCASNADVIVTEIRVHGSFDGVELVGRLRDAGETKLTPILVLTGCEFESDRQRARAAGCNVFLPKPCLPDQLISEICEVEPTTLKR